MEERIEAGKLIELELHHQNVFERLHDNNTVPGTIIPLFNSFVRYIEQSRVILSSNQKFFGQKEVAPLLNLLSGNFRLEEGSDRKTDYPQLQALFLMLRCSGIVDVEHDKAQNVFVVNKKVKKSWENLSPIEQYLNLLRIWLLTAHPEIIGEKGDSFRMVRMILWFILDTLTDDTINNTEFDSYIHSNPGLYNVSLCAMFGFVDFGVDTDSHKGRWRPKWIKRTPEGKAFLSLVLRVILSDNWYLAAYEAKAEVVINKWQDYFKLYFPNWNNNLLSCEHEINSGRFVFSVSLNDAWRKIAISGNCKLSKLCDYIISVFDFDSHNLYSIELNNKFGITTSYSCQLTNEPPYVENYKVGELGMKTGDTLHLIYDFTYGWEFEITVEAINNQVGDDAKAPVLIDKKGTPPKSMPSLPI